MSDAADILVRCQKDPEFYFREILGANPWPTQVAIAESVRDNRHTAVPSCHSSGKSWVAARVGLWFGSSFPDSKVITTAPTERQTKGILWSELHKARNTALYPIGGEPTGTMLKFGDDWYIWGFTAPDWDPNRFQGFHAPHLLIIVDESAGISEAISDQIDSLMAGGNCHRLDIGNPVEANTPFQSACNSDNVNTIIISAFDTPNFLHFGITEKDMLDGTWESKVDEALPSPSLITPQWVSERLDRWGADSDQWRSRILGKFPHEVRGAYYGEALNKARDDGRIGSFGHDPDRRVHTCWDLGVADSTAIWFCQRYGDRFRMIDYWEATGVGLQPPAEGGASVIGMLEEKARTRGFTYGEHIVPPDIAVREWGNAAQSRLETARRLGYVLLPTPQTTVKLGSYVADRIDACRRLINRSEFDEEHCADGLLALASYRREINKRTGELKPNPEHDWSSHCADALGYGAIGFTRQRPTSRPKPNTGWVT